jgi:hypothetical protein
MLRRRFFFGFCATEPPLKLRTLEDIYFESPPMSPTSGGLVAASDILTMMIGFRV